MLAGHKTDRLSITQNVAHFQIYIEWQEKERLTAYEEPMTGTLWTNYCFQMSFNLGKTYLSSKVFAPMNTLKFIKKNVQLSCNP